MFLKIAVQSFAEIRYHAGMDLDLKKRLADTLDRLAASPVCEYLGSAQTDSPKFGATEPSAIAALALLGHGRKVAAEKATDFFAEIQSTSDGSVGVRRGETAPKWATSWAIMSWIAVDPQRYAANIEKALEWTLTHEGERLPRNEQFGHDTRLAAWSWADGTHSWLEPSALFTIALKIAGKSQHKRTREAVTLLVDRLLKDGGCNYGNTVVLGQTLRPHVQPTGIVLTALSGEKADDPRIEKSLDFLDRRCLPDTPTASLSWGFLALAAWNRSPKGAKESLTLAMDRAEQENSPYKLALCALAWLGDRAPPISLMRPAGPDLSGEKSP